MGLFLRIIKIKMFFFNKICYLKLLIFIYSRSFLITNLFLLMFYKYTQTPHVLQTFVQKLLNPKEPFLIIKNKLAGNMLFL